MVHLIFAFPMRVKFYKKKNSLVACHPSCKWSEACKCSMLFGLNSLCFFIYSMRTLVCTENWVQAIFVEKWSNFEGQLVHKKCWIPISYRRSDDFFQRTHHVSRSAIPGRLIDEWAVRKHVNLNKVMWKIDKLRSISHFHRSIICLKFDHLKNESLFIRFK